MIQPIKTLTPKTIKKWAYKKSDQVLPLQLEELGFVVENGELLMSLASDKDCPKRVHILSCLYSHVGRSVSKHLSTDMGLINILLNKAVSYQDVVILNWVSRSRVILRDLRKYDYIEWCGGGFVRKDLP